MLRRWRWWLAAAGGFLLVVGGFGAWWYQDRSELEALRAEALDRGLAIEPPAIERSRVQDDYLDRVRALDLAATIYEPAGYWYLPQAVERDEDFAALRAHWATVEGLRVDTVESTLGQTVELPVADERWDRGLYDIHDLVQTWWRQRLLVCPPEQFATVVAGGHRSSRWSVANVAFADEITHWRDVVAVLALRWRELEPHRAELAAQLERDRRGLVARYHEALRREFAQMMAAADGPDGLVDHVGVRLPRITEHCLGLLDRLQAADMLREQMEWTLDAQGIDSLHDLRTECGRRFGIHVQRDFHWSQVFSLRHLTWHGGYMTCLMAADEDFHVALAIAALRGEPLPADPIGGRPLVPTVADGMVVLEGAPDPWWLPTRPRRFVLHPVPASP